MGTTFIVQIKTEDKWKAVYKGPDATKATASHHIATDQVGNDKVRVLKSNGTNDDGTTRWELAEIPMEETPQEIAEPKSQGLESGIVGVPRGSVIRIGLLGLIAIPVVATIAWWIYRIEPYGKDITYIWTGISVVVILNLTFDIIKQLRRIHKSIGLHNLYSNAVNHTFDFNKQKGRSVSRKSIAFVALPIALIVTALVPYAVGTKVTKLMGSEFSFSPITGEIDKTICAGNWQLCRSQEELIAKYAGLPVAREMCAAELQLVGNHSADLPWLNFRNYYPKERSFETGRLTLIEPKVGSKNAEGYMQFNCKFDLNSSTVIRVAPCRPGLPYC